MSGSSPRRWSRILGFQPLPGTFFFALAGIVVVYLVLAEIGKYWFYRLYRAPATPAPRHRIPATACTAAPPASPPTPSTRPAGTTPVRARR